ncbi:hypothetical protein DXG01_003653 [Tephrocybe rancida]|nr:hypothetical protein DXG01_003653 [Tephrocybe rancida]
MSILSITTPVTFIPFTGQRDRAQAAQAQPEESLSSIGFSNSPSSDEFVARLPSLREDRSFGPLSLSFWGSSGPEVAVDVPSVSQTKRLERHTYHGQYRRRYHLSGSPDDNSYIDTLQKYHRAMRRVDRKSEKWLKARHQLNTLESLASVMNSRDKDTVPEDILSKHRRNAFTKERELIRAFKEKNVLEADLLDDGEKWCMKSDEELVKEHTQIQGAKSTLAIADTRKCPKFMANKGTRKGKKGVRNVRGVVTASQG